MYGGRAPPWFDIFATIDPRLGWTLLFFVELKSPGPGANPVIMMW